MKSALAHVRANVVAYLALFFALGGTAIAAAPIITSSDQIATGVVTSDDIADNTIRTFDMATGAVYPRNIFPGAVGSSALAADAVTQDEIADGAVATSELAGRAVTAPKLAPGSVGNGAIADRSLSPVALRRFSIGNDELGNGAVRAHALGPIVRRVFTHNYTTGSAHRFNFNDQCNPSEKLFTAGYSYTLGNGGAEVRGEVPIVNESADLIGMSYEVFVSGGIGDAYGTFRTVLFCLAP